MKRLRHWRLRIGQAMTEYVLLLSITCVLSLSLSLIYQETFARSYQQMQMQVMFPYVRAKYEIFRELLPDPLKKIFDLFYKSRE